MKFRQIEAFRYVMLRGTTAAAANEMHVSQPAISRLISDLEYSLGFMLFDRHKGRLKPTEEAIEFFRAVDENFLGLERLTFLADQIRTKQPKQLKISCTPSLATSLLPLAMAEHKALYPEERMVVYTDNIGPLMTKLQSNAVDLAIGLQLPSLVGIKSESIGSARYVFAAKAGHRLAKKSLIRPEDLAGETLLSVVLDKHPGYWKKISDSFSSVDSQLNKTIDIDAAHTGYAMIAAGLAVAVIEPFSAKVWENAGIITRPFEPVVSYEYDLAFPAGIRHHQSANSFADIVKKVASKMPEFSA